VIPVDITGGDYLAIGLLKKIIGVPIAHSTAPNHSQRDAIGGGHPVSTREHSRGQYGRQR
jgi:hypothetical protein